MGDMADYTLGLMADIDELYLKYQNDPTAMYKAGLIDERGYDPRYIKPPKTCRCCGTGNLHWKNIGNKWLLHTEKGVMHNCPVNPFTKESKV